jgi:hypothetical protein
MKTVFDLFSIFNTESFTTITKNVFVLHSVTCRYFCDRFISSRKIETISIEKRKKLNLYGIFLLICKSVKEKKSDLNSLEKDCFQNISFN